MLGFITRRECALRFGNTNRLSPMTTLLSLLAAAGGGDGNVLVVLLFDDDTDAAVNEIDTDDDRRGLADDDVAAASDIVAVDVFSSFDAFSTSDFITAAADDSLMLLVSTTTGMLSGSAGRLFFELLGFSFSPWDGDDNADLPQAVGERIERRRIIILFFADSLQRVTSLCLICIVFRN